MKRTIIVISFLAMALAMQGQTPTNITAQGSDCATTNACASLTFAPSNGGVGIDVSGTFSATLQFEVSVDGTHWRSAAANPAAGGAAVTSTTGAGGWQINVAGMVGVRVRCSSFSSGTAVVTLTAGTASARSGGSSSSGVTSIATTSPITGGTITTTGTIACATCTTSAAALTNTALVTGGGLQAEQTPSATSTLDSSGNASFAGTLAATGHTTFEGVTSTGATGTGKLVYDTSPTLTTPNLGTPSAINLTNATNSPYALPVYSTPTTGISMTSGTGTITAICSSGICSMTTPGADGTYRFVIQIIETTVGSGGTCTLGTVRAEISYRDADTGVTFTTQPAFLYSSVNGAAVVTAATMAATNPGAGNNYTSFPREFRAKAGTAITFNLNQVAGSNCTTPPVFTIRPALYGPLGY